MHTSFVDTDVLKIPFSVSIQMNKLISGVTSNGYRSFSLDRSKFLKNNDCQTNQSSSSSPFSEEIIGEHEKRKELWDFYISGFMKILEVVWQNSLLLRTVASCRVWRDAEHMRSSANQFLGTWITSNHCNHSKLMACVNITVRENFYLFYIMTVKLLAVSQTAQCFLRSH